MNVESLKVLLEVLLQELKRENETNDNYLPCKYFNLPKKVFDSVVPDLLRNVIENIRKQAVQEAKKADFIRGIIYKCLLVIFLNTNQRDRFLYFHDIMNYLYDKLIQKLIEIEKKKLIVSMEDFYGIVLKLLPFVKLEMVKEIHDNKENGNKFKVSVMELYETALYPTVSREDCYEIIKNKIGRCNDVEFSDYEISPVDEKNGFLGEYFRLKIVINNNKDEEEHRFFVKHLPTNSDELRKNMAEVSFKKEETFYFKIVPHLRALGFDAVTDFLPECYLTRKNKFMVFDDASAKHFSILDIKTPFKYEEFSAIFAQLAKFHCCGILFEEKMSELLRTDFKMNEYYAEMLTETFADRNNAHTKIFFDCSINTNNYVFEKFPNLFKPDTLDVFKRKCESAFNKYFDIVEPSKASRNFITHGDLWCNNILFDKHKTSCTLIDFQIIRYNSPGYDIYFLLSTNTDLATRMTYGPKLIYEYYCHLKANLARYGVNVKKILDYDQILGAIETAKPVSLVVALSYLLIMLLPKEKMARIYENPELSQAFFSIDRSKIIDQFWDDLKYKSRFEDIIRELCLLVNTND